MVNIRPRQREPQGAHYPLSRTTGTEGTAKLSWHEDRDSLSRRLNSARVRPPWPNLILDIVYVLRPTGAATGNGIRPTGYRAPRKSYDAAYAG